VGKFVFFFKKFGAIVLLGFSCLFYKFFPKVKQDNPVEETVEVVLLHTLDEDIDLSPETPETKEDEE
jgi:hypothetical protein